MYTNYSIYKISYIVKFILISFLIFVYSAEKGEERLDIIDRIFELIAQNKTTANSVSKATGISQPLFTQWKQRKQSPSTENINKIAKHFNVSVDYLLGNEEPTKVIDDDDIKFAMFGTTDVTDEEFEDVKRYAQFIKDRKKNESK